MSLLCLIVVAVELLFTSLRAIYPHRRQNTRLKLIIFLHIMQLYRYCVSIWPKWSCSPLLNHIAEWFLYNGCNLLTCTYWSHSVVSLNQFKCSCSCFSNAVLLLLSIIYLYMHCIIKCILIFTAAIVIWFDVDVLPCWLYIGLVLLIKEIIISVWRKRRLYVLLIPFGLWCYTLALFNQSINQYWPSTLISSPQ